MKTTVEQTTKDEQTNRRTNEQTKCFVVLRTVEEQKNRRSVGCPSNSRKSRQSNREAFVGRRTVEESNGRTLEWGKGAVEYGSQTVEQSNKSECLLCVEQTVVECRLGCLFDLLVLCWCVVGAVVKGVGELVR